MQWTAVKPTKPGWYWLRSLPNQDAPSDSNPDTILRVDYFKNGKGENKLAACHVFAINPVFLTDAVIQDYIFAGPIPEPDCPLPEYQRSECNIVPEWSVYVGKRIRCPDKNSLTKGWCKAKMQPDGTEGKPGLAQFWPKYTNWRGDGE